MSIKNILTTVFIGAIVIVLAVLFFGGFAQNEAQNWQHVQSVRGTQTIRDRAGWYLKMFATVTTYPRFVDVAYNDKDDEGGKAKESIRVTFNDGSTAQIETFTRYATPAIEQKRLEFHQQFSGNIRNASYSLKAHLINCIKTTGPLMSATENQAARKAEFTNIIENQLSNGLYEMKQVTRELKDRYDEDGRPITVQATEIITNEKGVQVVAQQSPLTDYGMGVLQFSVTGIVYDTETLAQFSAKKQSFLAAAKSKAQQAEMIAERLKIEEEGKKDKAQQEAISNVAKAKAVIAAELKAEVALQTKIQAETKAAQGLSVAKIAKEEKLTIANMGLEVAQINALEAAEVKRATILKAEGRKEAIELSGDITEIEQAMIDAEVAKAEAVAKAMENINVPQIMFIGGGEGASPMMENLINMKLMESTGLFDKAKVNVSSVTRQVDRSGK